MPHQWMEGNLPVASKCIICEKTCGSVLRYKCCFHIFFKSIYLQFIVFVRNSIKIALKFSK